MKKFIEETINSDTASNTVTDDEDNTEYERERWSRKIEYMLSMIGYCVGLGNIWRFSYICMRNGGGAFLIPFMFFLVTCGLPLYFLEVCIAQFLGKGVVGVWEVCPLFRGIGIGMVIMSCIMGFYYNMITAWIIYYIANSFISPLPWSTCDNQWNTNDCLSDRSTDFNNINTSNTVEICNGCSKNGLELANESGLFNHTNKGVTSEEEFWQYQVLHISSGIDEIGNLPWHLPVCYLVAWIVICLTLIKGVRSVGKPMKIKEGNSVFSRATVRGMLIDQQSFYVGLDKTVVYVTATLPYLILTVLIIRGVTLPGGIDGVVFYLKPTFERLLDKKVWVEAALQVFYSLGPTWGALITMASYTKFNNNCLRDAIFLTFFAEGTSIYGGLAVFSILGYMALNLGLPIDKVVQSGPGLGFIAYPEAISLLPVSNMWAFLFFVMLFTLALDSMFVTVEIVTSSLLDSYPELRKRQSLLTVMTCLFLFLIGLPLCSQGGVYIFQLIDWYIAALSVIIFGLLECLIFGWIYGIERFSNDVMLMLGRPIPGFFRWCICFITPAILIIVFVFTMLAYSPPNYGSYQYPDHAEIIGWFIASLPIMPLPFCCIYKLKKAKGDTILQKLRHTLRPSPLWKPNNKSRLQNNENYSNVEYKTSILKTVKYNLIGEIKN